MAPRGSAQDECNIYVLHESARVQTRTESSPFDARYNRTSSHVVARAAEPLRNSVHATGDAAQRHARRAAIPASFVYRSCSAALRSAAYAILNALTY
eukprot:255298-Pleurochrysis_carterae.AAC.1